MGQKVNPVGFRLGYIEKPRSRWVSKGKGMIVNLIQDQKIRDYIALRLATNGVCESIIEKTSDQVIINISTSKPGSLIGKAGVEVEKLRKEFVSLTGKNVLVNISDVKHPEASAKLMAESIAQQIKKRVSYNKVIKQAMSSCMRSGVEGVKLRISGRLEGAEMARSEEFKEGSVPLHTLRAKIDYIAYPIHTIYGVIGLKIWVYTGQVYNNERFSNKSFIKDRKRL